MKKFVFFLFQIVVLILAGCSQNDEAVHVKNNIFTEDFCSRIESVEYSRLKYHYDYLTLITDVQGEKQLEVEEIDKLNTILQNMVLESQEMPLGTIGGTPGENIHLKMEMKDGSYIWVVFYYDDYDVILYEFEDEFQDNYSGKCYYVDQFTDVYCKLEELGEGQ